MIHSVYPVQPDDNLEGVVQKEPDDEAEVVIEPDASPVAEVFVSPDAAVLVMQPVHTGCEEADQAQDQSIWNTPDDSDDANIQMICFFVPFELNSDVNGSEILDYSDTELLTVEKHSIVLESGTSHDYFLPWSPSAFS